MGLFSFGNKENSRRSAGDKYDTRDASGGRASRADKAALAREKAAQGENRSARRIGQEILLDPLLLEKRRARRRLLGAVVLVVVAIVVLSKVLEPGPRPQVDEIAIHVAAPTKITPATALGIDTAVSGVRSRLPESLPTAQKAFPNATSLAAKAAPNIPSVVSSQPAQPTRKPASPPTVTNMPPVTAINSSKPVNATNARRAAAAPSAPVNSRIKASPQTTNGVTGSVPSQRFAVQLGTLYDEPRARAWIARLKAANIPAYLERKKLANGSQQLLVRAGPFNDRVSAEAASKRIRELGLAQMKVKTGKPTLK